MHLTGNTIFITGGGSGIGRGLAEALHGMGNQVIISGRRRNVLEQVVQANPGMDFVELNIENPKSIQSVADHLIQKYSGLNVLINNAGIMKPDGVDGVVDDAAVAAMVTTNLLGPIRMTSALIEQLKKQTTAYIVHVSSGLAFVPLAMSATYCATKAALHSLTLSQRYLLKGTSVKVLELAPPYVQTELGGDQQANDPRAMNLQEFIDEVIKILGTDANEILVERVGFLRNGAGPNDYRATEKLNQMFAG